MSKLFAKEEIREEEITSGYININKLIVGSVVGGVLFLISLVVLFGSMFVTKENEYALVREFGKIKTVISEPGLNFKVPMIQSVKKVPKDQRFYDLASSDVITADKKTMIVDCYVIWKIDDPLKFMQTLGGSIGSAEQRLDANVYNALKNTISGMTQEEVIAARESASDLFLNSLSESYKDYGLEVITIDVKRLDLPEDNKNAVYNRMISERNNIAAQFKAEGESEAQLIKNKADKEVSIMKSNAKKEAEKLIATGEAEYMRILSESYNDESKAEFYSFVRSLDAAKASLKNNENILILSKDSPIVEIFYK